MPDISDARENFSTVNVTLTTTSETVIISSGVATVTRPVVRALVLAFAQLTTGAGTTGVTKRIRRGTLTTDTLIGEANDEPVKAVAGSTEEFYIMVAETLTDLVEVQYSLTLSQTAATGNGTALQAGILVLIL